MYQRPSFIRLAIATIESLFPADSPQITTADIGRRLLEQAKRDMTDWRDEPEPVLRRYAELCLEEEQRLQALAQRARDHRI